MKKKVFLLLIIGVILLVLSPIVKAKQTEGFAEDSIIVVVKHEYSIINKIYNIEEFEHSNIESIEDLTKINGNVDDKELLNIDEFCQILLLNLKEEGIEEVQLAIDEIERLEFVKSVTPNYIMKVAENEVTATSNDTQLSSQYALDKIGVKNVWNYTTGSDSVLVGVIDSGIEATHQDLIGNVSTTLGENFTGDNYGLTDPYGHGTHVAGIIGAQGNNNLGVSRNMLECYNGTFKSI